MTPAFSLAVGFLLGAAYLAGQDRVPEALYLATVGAFFALTHAFKG